MRMILLAMKMVKTRVVYNVLVDVQVIKANKTTLELVEQYIA